MFAVVQKKLDGINKVMLENVAGARVVKAYVKEEYELGRFDEANEALCNENLRVQTLLAFMSPCMNIVLNLCIVGVILVGGYTVKAGGTITPGNTMAAITYLAQILHGITFMANIFQTFSCAKASADRINEVLQRPESSDQNVLENISFQVNSGETLAIIGSTGSGKTTVVNLLMRFYPVDAGEILMDGVNIQEIKRDELLEDPKILILDEATSSVDTRTEKKI